MKSRLVFFPPIQTQHEADDLIARCGWYFYPYVDQVTEIVLLCPESLIAGSSLPSKFDIDVELGRRRILEKITAVSGNEDGADILRQLDPRSDCLLVWNIDSDLLKTKAAAEAVKKLRAKGRYYEVDPQNTRMEGSFYLWAGLNVFVEKDDLISRNRERLSAFRDTLRNTSKAYVFGTGPTLSSFCETHDFSDGSCIIANSMVKNQKLLDQLRPVAIVAGDPIFHAGCSRYAGEFRRSLLKAMTSTDAYLFVPLRDYNIHATYLPTSMHERIIGVPFEAKRPYTIDLSKDFFVSPLANILTLLLFPLAGTISREVNVVGCDGRPLDQDQYFWEHDKASQFNAEMDNIRQVHPGFFAIDYNDYYTEHCRNVKSAIESLEKGGRQVASLTPSHIPALADRFAKTNRDADARRTDTSVRSLIAIDPDAKDHFGHFLSYDARIAEAARDNKIRFSMFGNTGFDVACLPESIDTFVPAFSVNSWTIGNRPAGAAQQDIDRFRAELWKAVDTLPVLAPQHQTVLYMYCGSLEHAELVQEMLDRRSDLSANVNLFWAYAFDESEPGRIERWAPFLRKAARHPRLTLTLPTTKLQQGFAKHFGVHLAVAPHPSTTFSDREAALLTELSSRTAPARPVILFPGGMRKEKGFPLSVRAARLLSDTLPVDCVLRGLVTSGTPRDMQGELASLSGSKVVVESGEFDDQQFRQFLEQGDVIVCPYQAPDFSRRTSGLVVDAMLLGRPVVALKDTWLGDFVVNAGLGVACDATPAGIFDAVRLVLDDYEHYATKAGEARKEYLAGHSWERLVDTIMTVQQKAVAGPSESTAYVALEYDRDDNIRVDETEVVAQMSLGKTGRSHVMVDVGAHFGTSASYFDALGWTIHCFEPDPSNREKLVKRLGKKDNVTIDSRAVSDKPAKGVSFFKSEESTGISGLHAFRDTHKEASQVDVTTIAEVVKELGIERIDFLKVDVEGFDLSVIKGVPWERLRPEIIECEFEDLKTVPLGHTYKDAAQFLVDQGYAVYLSEWHPIIRYGIPHDWYRLVRFPGVELAPDSWGNMLAFKVDPGIEAVSTAFSATIARRNPGRRASSNAGANLHKMAPPPAAPTRPVADTSQAGSTQQTASTPPSQSVLKMKNPTADAAPQQVARIPKTRADRYERFVLWARQANPLVNTVGRFAIWTLRTARHHTGMAIGAVASLAILLVAGLLVPSPAGSIALWLLAALLAAGFLVVAMIGFVNHMVQRATNEAKSRLATLERRLGSLDSRERDARAKAASAVEDLIAASEASSRKKADVLDRKVAQLTSEFARHVQLVAVGALSVNDALYQQFNRTLKQEQAQTLLGWGEPLGLELNTARIAYLAHRACLLESQMKGRLATSIEAIVLRSLVCSAPKRTNVSILEIGTLFGIGAAAVYEAAANAHDKVHLTVIDPLDGYYASGRGDLLTGAHVNEVTLRQNWSLAPIPEQDYTIIRHFSSDDAAIKAAMAREYDVLIIDGDHSLEGVKADFENYAPMVRPGGYILFDDYDVRDWPDIKRYVDSEIADLPMLHRVGAAFRSIVFQVKRRIEPRTGATASPDAQ